MVGDNSFRKTRQVWSNMSGGFLTLRDTTDVKVITASSTTETPSFEWYEATIDPLAMSWYLVFTASNSIKYVLSVNDENKVTAMRFTDDMEKGPSRAFQNSMFVPDPFASGSPFQRLLLTKDKKKCLAAGRDGSLTVKTLNTTYPHPETIFVISEH